MRFALFFFSFVFCFSSGLFSPIEPPKFDKEKAKLGEKLYFETKFSENKLSCDRCHNIYLNQSGTSKDKNAPTILNSALSTLFFSNGTNQSLKEKIKRSLTAKHELNSNPSTIESVVRLNSSYTESFKKLYKNGVNFENIADSLEHFVKTLVTPNSKFDHFLRNELKLNEDEQEGYELFLDLGCASCHNGVNLGSNNFQKSLNSNALIKVPTLRNITKTAPYIGDIENLSSAILQMSIKKINTTLSDYEIDKIIKFLETLSGELQ
ncbi:MAG: c-type cytochrome [Campylobacter sp.]|nr:c-type cytochrome [Campylobacter sp.]